MLSFGRIMALTSAILGLLVMLQMGVKTAQFQRVFNIGFQHNWDEVRATADPTDDVFLLGAGRADITG
jgi:hypothetical protein